MAKLLDDRLRTIATKENVNQLMEKVSHNTEALNKLRDKVGNNAEEIESIKLTVARLERESDKDEDRMEEWLQDGGSWTAFHKSRCSIRIWPSKVKPEEELGPEVRKFITGALKVPQQEYDDLQISGIRRVRSAPSNGIHNEILVTFSNPDQQDYVSPGATGLLSTSPMANQRPE